MLFRYRLRRALANSLALTGAFLLVAAVAIAVPPTRGSIVTAAALLAAAVGAWATALRLNLPARVRPRAVERVVLFETRVTGIVTRDATVTVRGARDAIEHFIPLREFRTLFGGWALWAPPDEPIAELPDEALGVWGRRTCSRLRRVLRERGAIVELRREPGPAQRIAALQRR